MSLLWESGPYASSLAQDGDQIERQACSEEPNSFELWRHWERSGWGVVHQCYCLSLASHPSIRPSFSILPCFFFPPPPHEILQAVTPFLRPAAPPAWWRASSRGPLRRDLQLSSPAAHRSVHGALLITPHKCLSRERKRWGQDPLKASLSGFFLSLALSLSLSRVSHKQTGFSFFFNSRLSITFSPLYLLYAFTSRPCSPCH